MNPSLKTRRQFLGEASCASLGSISVLASLLNLKLTNQAAAANLPSGNDCKTLVCILLAGGCDTFNLLVRRDGGYNDYAASRSDMALPKADLINLNQAGGGDGNLYGIHPSCQGLADMFNGTGEFAASGPRLSMVSNIGTLVQPVTKAQYVSSSSGVKLPKSLFSHIDQINQWQTSVPQGLSELSGWAGRMADVIHSEMNTGATSMSISLAGNNVFQIGKATRQFAITQNGALLPTGNSAGLNNITARKNLAVDGLLGATYRNLMQDAFADHVKLSHESQRAFDAIYKSIDDSAIAPLFPNSNIAKQLLTAAKTIKARDQLGLRRSTIFIQRGGWDHHGELLNTQAGMLTELSEAIAAYQKALEILGVADDVISYTASDFGRTLRSNGRGTDHAWGGNQMVWGGPVAGGKVYGAFPDLALNSNDDIGLGGRMLPTTSIDKFYEEMALWFGVSSADMDLILPNIGNFSSSPDLGFIA
ncbi:DUF1501 domain-containing protein [Luteolibacter algae]|uniref:DUF1501 domain-containing protein n=1 Tax=Luteolibacter algae TaxID=454151 RepID=A0ABW5D767_9BACT